MPYIRMVGEKNPFEILKEYFSAISQNPEPTFVEEENEILKELLNGIDVSYEDVIGIVFLPKKTHETGRHINTLYLSQMGNYDRKSISIERPPYDRLWDEVQNEDRFSNGFLTIMEGVKKGSLVERLKKQKDINPKIIDRGKKFNQERILLCYIE